MLLIGGTADGDNINVGGRSRDPLSIKCTKLGEYHTPPKLTEETYIIENIFPNMQFARHESLTFEQAVHRLMDKYKP